jgi:hypothetical protein
MFVKYGMPVVTIVCHSRVLLDPKAPIPQWTRQHGPMREGVSSEGVSSQNRMHPLHLLVIHKQPDGADTCVASM